MSITVTAVYENGVLRPKEPFPLREKEEVRVSVEPALSPLLAARGIIGWKGTDEELDRLLHEIEFGEEEGT